VTEIAFIPSPSDFRDDLVDRLNVIVRAASNADPETLEKAYLEFQHISAGLGRCVEYYARRYRELRVEKHLNR
jgi:hypothetical protein